MEVKPELRGIIGLYSVRRNNIECEWLLFEKEITSRSTCKVNNATISSCERQRLEGIERK